MIIVTGPNGNTGRQIISGLQEKQIPFVALARSPERQRQLTAQGIPNIFADLEQPDSLRAAFEMTGADRAFLVCTPDARLTRCEKNFIAAAKASGIRHIVKAGAYAADRGSESPNLRMHAEVEDALRESGVSYTIVRPHGFMQTFFWMSAPLVMQEGILSYPAGDGPIPLIDVRDAGSAMLKVLTEPGYENRAFNLTGPEALTSSQMAETLSSVMGRPIKYVESNLDDLDALMRQMGVPDYPREHVLWCFREQAKGSFNYTSSDHQDLGLPLRTYAEFAADLMAGKTSAATSDFSR